MRLIYIILFLIFIPMIASASDRVFWQGQYYIENKFQQGTYLFEFNIYDSEFGGNVCFSNTTYITTGVFGQWSVYANGISALCNNSSKDYYIELKINNITQYPRRFITSMEYLRKNVDEKTTGNLSYKNQNISCDKCHKLVVPKINTPSLNNISSYLNSDTILTVNVPKEILNLTLNNGTWFLIGSITFNFNSNNKQIICKLSHNTTNISSTQITGSKNILSSITLSGIINLNIVGNIKVICTSNDAATIRSQTIYMTSSKTATYIHALRIG